MAREASFRTASQEETIALGRVLGGLLREGDVLVLTGDLGAGKTQLTKGIAAGMGVTADVTSPTFTIEMVYRGREMDLDHFDLYRLDRAEQLEDTGLFDVLGADGVCVIEWGERRARGRVRHTSGCRGSAGRGAPARGALRCARRPRRGAGGRAGGGNGVGAVALPASPGCWSLQLLLRLLRTFWMPNDAQRGDFVRKRRNGSLSTKSPALLDVRRMAPQGAAAQVLVPALHYPS